MTLSNSIPLIAILAILSTPISSAAQYCFEANEIAGSLNDASSLSAADLNKDGAMDIIGGSFDNNWIGWYENNGLGSFTYHKITSDAEDVSAVHAADFNNDGNMDILSANKYDSEIHWYENDGQGNFTDHIIFDEASLASDVYTADINGDGHIDALSSSSAIVDERVDWHENDGNGNFVTHKIGTGGIYTSSVHSADINDDGHPDVIAAGLGGTIFWYENDGNGNFTTHTLNNSVEGVIDIESADLDNNGLPDIICVAGDKIVWYHNKGGGTFAIDTILASADFAVSAFSFDLNQDGDVDVISGINDENRFVWHENDGNGNFTQHLIAEVEGAGPVFAADVDSDGMKEAVGSSSKGVEWFDLSVIPQSTDTVAACNSFTWTNGITYTSSTSTAKDTFHTAGSCDSIVTLNLTITKLDTSVTKNGATLVANEQNASYQWLRCDSGYTPIDSATSQAFTPQDTGKYAVSINENGCTDTSTCHVVRSTGIMTHSATQEIRVYPIPTQGNITFELNKKYKEVKLVVQNVLGQTIVKKNFKNTHKLTTSLKNKSDGIYFVHITMNGNKRALIKVVKQ